MIEFTIALSWQQLLALLLLWALLNPLMTMLGRDAYHYIKGKIK